MYNIQHKEYIIKKGAKKMEEKVKYGKKVQDALIVDKELMFENIKAVAKRNQIPIGQLEQSAGVSVGYLSRRSSRPAQIGFWTVVKLAKILNVSIDDLVYRNLTRKLNKTESKIYDFLEKIKRDTHNESVNWSFYEANYLNSFNGKPPDMFDKESVPSGQLFDLIDKGDNCEVLSLVHQIPLTRFSNYYSEGPTFYTEINPYVTLYITQIKYIARADLRKEREGRDVDRIDNHGDVHSIELFLTNPRKNNLEELCNSNGVSPTLVSLIRDLCDEAEKSTNRVQLSDFSKSVIDGYLDPVNHPFKGPSGNDDIPF